MNKTLNYNLNKPEPNDFYDVEVFNQNIDKIDTELKLLSNKIVPAGQGLIIADTSGTITLPPHVSYINIMIIDGGNGGQGGHGSSYGTSSMGTGGNGGQGGKIISFSNLKTSGNISITIGDGGIGGMGGIGGGIHTSSEAGAYGTPGGITSVNINNIVYNSTSFSDFQNKTDPVFCPFTAEFYGKTGVKGIGGNGINYGDGGNGGKGANPGGYTGDKAGNGVKGCVIIHYIGEE